MRLRLDDCFPHPCLRTDAEKTCRSPCPKPYPTVHIAASTVPLSELSASANLLHWERKQSRLSVYVHKRGEEFHITISNGMFQGLQAKYFHIFNQKCSCGETTVSKHSSSCFGGRTPNKERVDDIAINTALVTTFCKSEKYALTY